VLDALDGDAGARLSEAMDEARAAIETDRGTLGDILVELRELRAERAAQDEPGLLATPFEVFTSALRDAGVTITAAQFLRTREILRRYGWTIRMEGLS